MSDSYYPNCMGSTCGETLIILQKEYKLDIRGVLKSCLTEPFIADIYFAKNKDNLWWSERFCARDIAMRLVMLNQVKRKTKGYNTEALYWIGYLYGYWCCKYGDDPNYIWERAPFDYAYAKYPAYHTVDIEEAIYMFKMTKECYIAEMKALGIDIKEDEPIKECGITGDVEGFQKWLDKCEENTKKVYWWMGVEQLVLLFLLKRIFR